MSTLKVNTIQNASGVEKYLCQAWVNFNGTGTVAIRASGNVASITDNGTGDYTMNFMTAMPDTNYVPLGAVMPVNGSNSVGVMIGVEANNATTPTPQTSLSTTSVKLACRRAANTATNAISVDSNGCYVAIFR